MNDHEIDRIAAAMNVARPDWPKQQLRTLIQDKLADRPRRDVLVALAWVASEPNSSSPYRVLEAGPWWRAAGVEGNAAVREPWDPGGSCAVCSQPEVRCRSIWSGDHDYISTAKHAQQVAAEKRDMARIATALKGELQPMREPAHKADLKHQPAGRATDHVQALRDAAGADREAANAAGMEAGDG